MPGESDRIFWENTTADWLRDDLFVVLIPTSVTDLPARWLEAHLPRYLAEAQYTEITVETLAAVEADGPGQSGFDSFGYIKLSGVRAPWGMDPRPVVNRAVEDAYRATAGLARSAGELAAQLSTP